MEDVGQSMLLVSPEVPSDREMGTGSCTDLVRDGENVNFKYNTSLTYWDISVLSPYKY